MARCYSLICPVSRHSRYLARLGATQVRPSSSWFQTKTSGRSILGRSANRSPVALAEQGGEVRRQWIAEDRGTADQRRLRRRGTTARAEPATPPSQGNAGQSFEAGIQDEGEVAGPAFSTESGALVIPLPEHGIFDRMPP